MAWSKKPSAFTAEIIEGIEQEQQDAATKILRRVIVTSPVDSGLFKSNWQVGLKTKKEGTVSNQGDALGKGISVIKSNKGLGSIWISNNLPYAERLNNGWSTQAPAGFVQAAIRVASE